METQIVTSLLGKMCHYDRIYRDDWCRTVEESEIVAVVVTNPEDIEVPKLWITVKNKDGNLKTVDSTDVFLVKEVISIESFLANKNNL